MYVLTTWDLVHVMVSGMAGPGTSPKVARTLSAFLCVGFNLMTLRQLHVYI